MLGMRKSTFCMRFLDFPTGLETNAASFFARVEVPNDLLKILACSHFSAGIGINHHESLERKGVLGGQFPSLNP